MEVQGFRNPSVMAHDFSQVPHADIPRSSFRRPHGVKTMFDAGLLIPIYVDEVLPGDTFNVRLTAVARLSTPLVPFMDNLWMDFHFFYVPNRLLWTNWERFCGAQDDPGDSTDFVVPKLDVHAGFAIGSLGDYFGLPTGIANVLPNAFHFRAYNLIWNEWFRDENLQVSLPVDKDNGPDTVSQYVVRRRGKRHDYFTSCLPWPQKGEAIDLPLGTVAPIKGFGMTANDSGSTGPLSVYETGQASTRGYAYYRSLEMGGALDMELSRTGTGPYVFHPELYADLAEATAATINSLREAFQLQRMLERDARGGTRYAEIIRSHFRVSSPDQRLQRPEYLGGGTRPVVIQPLAATSTTSSGSITGELAGVGFASASGIGFSKSFVEHGVILGLVSVRADLTYQRGLHRMWSRQTRYDYYWPALAHLGEQAVLNKEIFYQGTAADDLPFGYQERWAEYRYYPSLITGELRSTAATSLDIWHLSQDFAALPVLNASFIEEDPPVDRVVVVSGEPHFVFDGFFDGVVARPMPMYSVPGLIDHF